MRTLAFVVIAAAALLDSSPANARSGYKDDMLLPYQTPQTKLNNMCGNCHADWGGRETRNNLGVAFWMYYDNSAASVDATSDFSQLDVDGDGVNNTTEFVNSKSAAYPGDTVKWFPGYADKDGDGCIQLYFRSDENGMPVATQEITNSNGYVGGAGGFMTYGPKGWDIDDNDATQGCSTAWPTTATPGTFVTPGTTTDSTAPAQITNLKAASLAAGSLPLTWTAVADDGATGDAAHDYDLRYSTAALVTAKTICTAGSSAPGATACRVRDKLNWERMYDAPDTDVDNSAGTHLSKTGIVLTNAGTWNAGAVTPLMRALYEPIPGAPGATETYAISTKGTVITANTIVDGTTYWLATRVSDGVLTITGTVDAPTGFSELDHVSPVSNIVAVTAGASGAAIESYTPVAPINNGGSNTIVATGLGIHSTTNAAQMVLTNTAGTVVATGAAPTYTGDATSGTASSVFACGIAAGTYTLELRTSGAVTKAAWVDAITVTDNTCAPSGAIQFSAPTYSVAENGTTVTITATRTGGSSGAVGVSYATSDVTATGGGTDYTTTVGTLSWAAADTANKTFTVAINNDALAEPSETINLTLSSPTGGAVLGALPTAVLTIIDNDTIPTVQWTVSSQASAGESGSMTVTAQLSNPYGSSVTVPFTRTGNATLTSDFTISASPITIAAGATTGTATITLVNDTTNEGPETVILTMGAPTNATLGATTAHTATITDNDVSADVLYFSAATYNVTENGTTATITVSRNYDDTSFSQPSVTWTATAGTATAGSDYGSPTTGTLTWTRNIGVNSETFTIPITNDALAEANETITLTLSGASNATLGTQTTAVLTIIDDDVVPTLTTPTAIVTGSTTATLGATITSAGSSALTARGTCWGTTAAPVTNCVAEGGTATGVFTQARTGLAPSTSYFYRGYATNSVGTSYSADGTFTTAAPPDSTPPTFGGLGYVGDTGSGGTVTLCFNDATDASGLAALPYIIYYNTASPATSGSSLAMADPATAGDAASCGGTVYGNKYVFAVATPSNQADGVKRWFTVHAKDSVGNETANADNLIAIPYDRTLLVGYNMIGVGGELGAGIANATIFGDDVTSYRTVIWNSVTQGYASSNGNVEEGIGYMFLNSDGGTRVFDNPNCANTGSCGYSEYTAPQVGPVLVTLNKKTGGMGGNLVSNPCLTAVTASTAGTIGTGGTVSVVKSDGTTELSYADAVTSGYVSGAVYRWNPGLGNYQSAWSETITSVSEPNKMRPFAAYWVHVSDIANAKYLKFYCDAQ